MSEEQPLKFNRPSLPEQAKSQIQQLLERGHTYGDIIHKFTSCNCPYCVDCLSPKYKKELVLNYLIEILNRSYDIDV